MKLEESNNIDTRYYDIMKKEYNNYKKLYDKIMNYIKNYDEVKKNV